MTHRHHPRLAEGRSLACASVLSLGSRASRELSAWRVRIYYTRARGRSDASRVCLILERVEGMRLVQVSAHAWRCALVDDPGGSIPVHSIVLAGFVQRKIRVGRVACPAGVQVRPR